VCVAPSAWAHATERTVSAAAGCSWRCSSSAAS
jgi:hypothetical protein